MLSLPPKNTLRNTKRCAYCHKLQRADAQVCSLCGKSFIAKKAITKEPRRDVSIPSVPPASTYRAGHYAGFHPEDQPYESSMIAVQRPATAEPEQRMRAQPEPEHIVFPPTGEVLALKRQRESGRLTRAGSKLAQVRTQVHVPARVRRLPAYVRGKRVFSARVVSIGLTLSCICFLLAASIIAFALIGKHKTDATAIVKAAPDTVRMGDVFVLTGNGFTAGDLMTFTYDTNSPILNESEQPINAYINRAGGFSVRIPVSPHWTVGSHTIDALDTTAGMNASTRITIIASSSAPPALQLAQTQLQFPEAAAGVVSSQFVILSNSGGGKVVWRAQSDQPWLTFSPDNDAFAGAERVQVSVNRGNLAPQSYTGHIVFTQTDGKVAPSTLTVNMLVKPAQSELTISTTSLTYKALAGRNPADQLIILRNPGKKALDWNSSVSINESSQWLSLSPNHGRLEPGGKEIIAVSIQSLRLTPGLYQGEIDFTGGAQAQVHVNLRVLPPGSGTAGDAGAGGTVSSPASNDPAQPLGPTVLPDAPTAPPAGVQPAPVAVIGLKNTALHFSTVKGQNPAQQGTTITNTGNGVLQWTATISGSAGNVFTVAPAQGSLNPGASVQVTVGANVAGANPGTLTATITISGGAAVASQSIAVDVTINNPQPALRVTPARLTCSDASSVAASPRLTINNTGSQTVHWSAQRASTGADSSWLNLSNTDGTLAAGQSTTVVVTCDGGNMGSGTYSGTINFSDSDQGTLIQSIPVTFTIF